MDTTQTIISLASRLLAYLKVLKLVCKSDNMHADNKELALLWKTKPENTLQQPKNL
jgi:hypothetical protein